MSKECWQLEHPDEQTTCFRSAGRSPCSKLDCAVGQKIEEIRQEWEKVPIWIEKLLSHDVCRISSTSFDNKEYLERLRLFDRGFLIIMEELAEEFDCKPHSVKILRKTGIGKSFVILEAKKEGKPWIIKATRVGINVARLRNESRVLSLFPRDYLQKNGILIPELERGLTRYDGFYAIMISKMPKGRNPSFEDYCHVLDVFRKMEIPEELEIRRVEPEDYRRKAFKRLNALRGIGALKGLHDYEIKRIKKFYQENLKSLEPFDQVFVHGDFKEKHVRRVGEELVVIDFDKSVIGSELEDWAWLSVRHPALSARITNHLKEEMFKGNEEKLKNFDTAFRLMQIDRLIEAYFTRTYQWRGNLDAFSYGAKIRGRYAFNRLLKT